MAVAAVLGLSAATPINTGFKPDLGLIKAEPSQAQIRQKLDTFYPEITPQPPAKPVLVDEIDTVEVAIEFDRSNIRQLDTTGQTRVHIPGQGEVLFSVDHTRLEAGTTHMRLRQGNLVGSLTHRGETFFATLATPQAVYRVHGRQDQVVAHRHIDLDYRTHSHAQDYRRP